MPKPQEIIKGQGEITARGGQEGQEQIPAGDLPQITDDLLELAGPDFLVKYPKCGVKKEEHQQDGDGLYHLASRFGFLCLFHVLVKTLEYL